MLECKLEAVEEEVVKSKDQIAGLKAMLKEETETKQEKEQNCGIKMKMVLEAMRDCDLDLS